MGTTETEFEVVGILDRPESQHAAEVWDVPWTGDYHVSCRRCGPVRGSVKSYTDAQRIAREHNNG